MKHPATRKPVIRKILCTFDLPDNMHLGTSHRHFAQLVGVFRRLKSDVLQHSLKCYIPPIFDWNQMISLQNFSATAIQHNQKDTSREKLLHVAIATMVLHLVLGHLYIGSILNIC